MSFILSLFLLKSTPPDRRPTSRVCLCSLLDLSFSPCLSYFANTVRVCSKWERKRERGERTTDWLADWQACRRRHILRAFLSPSMNMSRLLDVCIAFISSFSSRSADRTKAMGRRETHTLVVFFFFSSSLLSCVRIFFFQTLPGENVRRREERRHWNVQE